MILAALRRLGATYLMPLPLVLALLGAGVVLLWLGGGPENARGRDRPGARRLGRLLVTAGAVLLAVLSVAPLPRALVDGLEDARPPYRPVAGAAPPGWVVVLCGGAGRVPGWPGLAGLSPQTLARLAEGVRIARLHPDARLVLTGGAPPDRTPCSAVLAEAAMELGVGRERIVTEAASRNTEEEAEAIAGIVGPEPFVLVTSASHVPRATALLESRGLRPLEAPVGGGRREGTGPFTGIVTPAAENLSATQVWAHEVLAGLWERVRGVR